MAELYDNKGRPFLVDDEDAGICRLIRWHSRRGYLRSGTVGTLARFLTGCPPGLMVDHANGDVRDNRKANLRVCSAGENQRNQGVRSDNTTGFKGVSFDKASGLYEAGYKLNGKQRKVGRFRTPELAAAAVSAARALAHGEFARDTW